MSAEFVSRLGYAAISALSIIVILLIIRLSDMPMADSRVDVATVLAYAAAAVVAHIVADVVSYVVVGFSARRILAWQGTFDVIATVVATGAAFAYVDSLTPGNTIVFGDSDAATTDVVQMWIVAMALACVVVSITASFAHSSGKRRRIAEIDKWCSAANQRIAYRNDKKRNNPREIFMDQIVQIDGNGGHQAEFAVSDVLYARRIDNNRTSISYCLGSKTYRMEFDATIAELLHAFERYKQVVQCHKDYIVNIDRIVKAERDEAGYCILHLKGTKRVVPVAEHYSGNLYTLLADEHLSHL